MGTSDLPAEGASVAGTGAGSAVAAPSEFRTTRPASLTLNSQETNRADFMANQMGFAEIFDELFFSCHVGYQKPHHGFYEFIQSALHMSGEQILFWDDMEKNVFAARELGWNAEVYKGFADFKARMAKLLNPEKTGN